MDNPMNWKPIDIESAQEILDGAIASTSLLPTPSPRKIIALTDEEIMILDGLQHPQLVKMPWMSSIDADNHQLISQVAMRGLIARGYVVPLGFAEGTESMQVDVEKELRGSLTLRRSGERIISMTHKTSLGEQWVYGYVHSPQRDPRKKVVLTEAINDGGIHEFSIGSLADFIKQLVVAADAEEHAHRDGEPASYTRDQLGNNGQGIADLGFTRIVSTVSIASKKDDEGGGEIRVMSFYADHETLRLLTVSNDVCLLREVTRETAAAAILDALTAT